MKVTPRLLALALLATSAGRAFAQEHAHPAPAERLGSLHFETSCAPAVAPKFDRAVAWLHSFEFGAAIRAFNDVIAADSTCAMAYWGVALSRWSNPMAPGLRSAAQVAPGRAAADAAMRLAPRATERERAYIDAVGRLYAGHERVDQATRVASYERAMADLVTKQPADTEAMIFHAIAVVATAPPTDKTFANQLRAGAMLESLWVKQPDHPGLAHYIIHAYDVPPLAARARAAAQRYADIAPSAAHALHMPSHTFTRVGLWKESVQSNLRSAEVALNDGAIGEALHATDYATYAWLQMHNDSAAKAAVDRVPALAARFDPTVISGAAPPAAGFYAIAAIPARYALERRDWRMAAALPANPGSLAWASAVTYFARALGAAHTGALATARTSIDSLDAMHRRLLAAGEPYWAEQVAIQRLGAQAWLDRTLGKNESALRAMREAANREDATEKAAVTPGPLAPARELLGDLLLDVGRPREALAEYRAAMLREPNRYRTLDGARRAAFAAGDKTAAADYAAQLKKLTSG